MSNSRSSVVTGSIVTGIRAASRDLVRELSFMNRTLAGTGLPPSAVHAIIEIGAAVNYTAKDLSEKLLLEKSTVSRLVKSLISNGFVQEARSLTDGRAKRLTLTHKGARLLAAITQFAEMRVSGALELLSTDTQQSVMEGLDAYASALTDSRLSGDRLSGGGADPHDATTLVAGYQPGLIGRIAQMHGDYYHHVDGFDVAAFEAIVAGGLSEFMPRVGNPKNNVWTTNRDGHILGAIVIDGEDLGNNQAHLRWFVMDDQLRGTGVGKTLLRAALEFCDAQDFSEVYLWTFQGLDAARRLYETHGFTLAEEYPGDQWGTPLTEQVFMREISS